MYDTALEMAKRLLVDSIWKSANLEGLGTTFPKTEAILSNAPTKTTTEEVLFIVNMKRAWQFLLDNLDYPDNLMFLRQINKLAGEGLFHTNGEVRTLPVSIGGTSWTPEIPNSAAVMEDIEKINAIENTELRALKFFCFAARTQIFLDGNKRVAQLIANKILISENIGIFQIALEDLEEFKTLLLAFYETGKDDALIDFVLEHGMKYVPKENT